MKTLYEVLVDRYPRGCVINDGIVDPCYRVCLGAMRIAQKNVTGEIDITTAITEADAEAVAIQGRCLGQVAIQETGCFAPTTNCGL